MPAIIKTNLQLGEVENIAHGANAVAPAVTGCRPRRLALVIAFTIRGRRRRRAGRLSNVRVGEYLMKLTFRSVVAMALFAVPTASAWALDLNPSNAGGGQAPIATPSYPTGQDDNPALTTGSRYSVTAHTAPEENPTVPGATGDTIVRGDNSTISGDRRGTIEQKTGGSAADSPG
jgi:hypothetical protein